MAQACSSGVPLPPTGEGAPTPTPVSPCHSPTPPSPPCFLALGGGLCNSWGVPPISWISLLMKGVRACSGGAPPLYGWLGSCPNLSSPSLHSVHWWRTLIGGSPRGVGWILGAPRSCMTCARSTRCSGSAPSSASFLQGIPSSRLGMPCAGSAHCLTGGSSPSSGINPRAVGARGPSLPPSSS